MQKYFANSSSLSAKPQMVKNAQRKQKLRIHFINKTPRGLEFKIKETGKANTQNKTTTMRYQIQKLHIRGPGQRPQKTNNFVRIFSFRLKVGCIFGVVERGST